MIAMSATPALGRQAPVAPVDRGIALRAGFYLGSDFHAGARTTHLEGFELGADLRLSRPANLGEISLSPSIAFGGSTRSGADADGNLYRVLLTLRHPISSNTYIGAGVGWSGVDARGAQFSNDSGVAAALLAGFNFGPAGSRSARPFLEVTYHAGSSAKLSGWSFDAGIRF